MINKRIILNLYSYVSKKIIEEGWKVGYMERNEPFREEDSGWSFLQEMKMMNIHQILEM